MNPRTGRLLVTLLLWLVFLASLYGYTLGMLGGWL